MEIPPRMGPGSLTRIALLLVFVSLCLSVDLSEKQIEYFKQNVRSWGAPAIAKVISGSSEKNKRGTQVMTLNYASDTGKDCTAELEKYKDGKLGHGYSCIENGNGKEIKVENVKGEKTKGVKEQATGNWQTETEEPHTGEGVITESGTAPTATEEDFERR